MSSFFVASAAAQTTTIRFAAPVTIPAAARYLTIGDLNRDGKADIIGASGNTVFVALGNGDGTFQPPTTYSLGSLGLSDVIGVITGDFNGDSKLDVVVITTLDGSDGGNAMLLLGNGDGTLQTPSSIATGVSPESVVAADLNGDQKLDLVIGGNGSASVLVGKGDGTFQPFQTVVCCVALPNVRATPQVAVGDINHDGKLDLVFGTVGTTGPPLVVYLGNGDGTFQTPTEIPFPAQPGTIGFIGSLVLADLNHDGNLDIVADETSSNQLGVLINNGDGTFKPAVFYYGGSTPAQLVAADFNADGNSDIAVADFNSSRVLHDGFGITVALGVGDGTLSQTSVTRWEPNQAPISIVSADLNGDGLPDLVTADGNDITVLINAPNSPPLPFALLSTTSLSFSGDTVVGASSTPLPITLSNPGYAPLLISSISISPDFTQSNDCPAQLAVGASCTIDVTFTPQATGSRSGTLSITQNSGVSPVVVNLSGTAISSYPVPTLTYLSPYGFVVGTAGPQTVTLTGSNFFPQTQVFVNGTQVSAQFVSSTTIKIQFASSDLANIADDLISAANPAPGGGATAAFHVVIYRSVQISARGLVFDAKRNVFYASVDQAGATNPNYLVSIDPNTGTVTPLVLAGTEPGVLALSADSQYLYAGVDASSSVIRVNLESNTIDETISLGSDPFFGAYRTGDLAVPVDAPGSVVVLKELSVSPDSGGIAMYDGTVPRSLSIGGGNSVDSILLFPNSTQLFSSDESSSLFALNRYTVDATGITYTDGVDRLGGGSLTTDGKFLFITNPAHIVDPNSLQSLGTFTFPSNFVSSMRPDPTTGEVYILSSGYSDTASPSAEDTQIYSGDPTNFTKIDELELPLYGSFEWNLLRWGSNGLAFRFYAGATNVGGASSTDQIVFLKTSLVSPHLSLSVTSVAFGGTNVGQSVAAASPLVLSNRGTTVINISGIVASGDFSQTNNCSSSLAPGQSCSVQVTFAPTVAGTRTGTLSVSASDSTSPHSVALSGTGIAVTATITLSAGRLNFPAQVAGTSSAPQSVTLTNAGTQTVIISGIAASGDFSQGNNCTSLVPGANCTVTVTFSPTKSGNESGTLTISSNASGSPQTVQLSGTGVDFSIAAGAGSQTTATVQAGSTAVYNLTLSLTSALPGVVNLACSGAPTNANCTVSPAQLDLSSGSAQAFSVSVNTTAATHSQLLPIDLGTHNSQPGGRTIALALLPAILLLMLWSLRSKSARIPIYSLALLVFAFGLLQASCGGGSSSSNTQPPPNNNFTPAGTYTLIVTATQASASRTISLTLVVR